MIFDRLTYALCLCLASAGFIGCSSSEEQFPRAAVRGIVLLDAEPLAEGVIKFIPHGENKGPKSSATIRNGMFKVDEEHGPIVGSSRIEIVSTDDGGFAPDDEAALKKLKASRRKVVKVIKVPAIYNSRSTMTKTISQEAENDFTFNLVSKRKR
ncbi:hypothetical protein [uncultured Gimesia sp.]|uniref:hypothetical protein n=1 Tax=uncultured Gimesia sp. TaxID=1678688 RepID=UPI0026060E7D|nr:hypothetical protein [uncultured Gimesia sp.]